MANQAIGGTVSFTIDGTMYSVRGNFEISAATVKRESIAGQSGVQGYTESYVVPSFKGDLTLDGSFSYATLEGITSSTMQVSLANGQTYVLSNAWFCSGTQMNIAEGRVSCEFGGLTMTQI